MPLFFLNFPLSLYTRSGGSQRRIGPPQQQIRQSIIYPGITALPCRYAGRLFHFVRNDESCRRRRSLGSLFPVNADSALQSLRTLFSGHYGLCSPVTARPFAAWAERFNMPIIGKGSWQSAFNILKKSKRLGQLRKAEREIVSLRPVPFRVS